VIIDASALLAVVLAEPDAARYAKAIATAADPHSLGHVVRGVDAG
jgi:uncharacterized protein with PIN domain